MKIGCPYCNAEFEVEPFSGGRKFQCGECEEKFLFSGGRSFKYGTFGGPASPGMDRMICPCCSCDCNVTRGTQPNTLVTCSVCRTTFAVPKPAEFAPAAPQYAPPPPPPVSATPQYPPPPQTVPATPVTNSSPCGGEDAGTPKNSAVPTGAAAKGAISGQNGKTPPGKVEWLPDDAGDPDEAAAKKRKYIIIGAIAAVAIAVVGIVVWLIADAISSSPKAIARKWQTAVVEQGIEKANDLYVAKGVRVGMFEAGDGIEMNYSSAARRYYIKKNPNASEDDKFDDKKHQKFFNEKFKNEKFDTVNESSENEVSVSSENYIITLVKFKKIGWKVIEFKTKK